ncbi:MAG: NADH-quinone oxidoreductase subunit NuoD [Gemmatimonadetes bacterium]|nr:NADH-quinone oxidoreductase subunit NuoD [Gemmatimonadota bacterium]|tara:strand:+ start:4866 stop:6068 length:1203 start_codon:yes stop_codon:yes gene_type:complete
MADVTQGVPEADVTITRPGLLPVIELEDDSLQSDMMTINMGPQHPSTHGVLRLEIKTDGEVVEQAIPHIGYLHRCFEKHAENLTYPQVIPFTDRMDYLAAMNNNLAYVLAVEKLLELEIPERVEYIRVIMAELNRIASHLVSFGTYGMDLGAFTPFLFAFREREEIFDLFEMTCGARMLYNYIWVGGVSHDLPVGFIEKTRSFLKKFEGKLKEYNDLLSYNKIFVERTANVGILSLENAYSYNLTGPNLRGSGAQWDLRKAEPYSIYDRLEFDVPFGKGDMGTVGDCWDRYMVRILEMGESARIVSQALDQLPEGDVHKAVPRNVKPPKDVECYFRSENPRGELGVYVISDGTNVPYRVRVKSPCFTAMSVFDVLCRGHYVADAVAIIGSLDIVLGEIDR